MTLGTRVLIQAPTSAPDVFHFCRALLGAPSGPAVRPEAVRRHPHSTALSCTACGESFCVFCTDDRITEPCE